MNNLPFNVLSEKNIPGGWSSVHQGQENESIQTKQELVEENLQIDVIEKKLERSCQRNEHDNFQKLVGFDVGTYLSN